MPTPPPTPTPTPTPTLRTPQDSPQMPSSPLQRISRDAARESHGNDTVPSPNTPPADETRSPLSPSDCRTLKKIIEDVQSPSRAASPLLTEHNDRLLGIVESTDDGSSDTGHEDEAQYTEKQYDYGDEADEGYADEDDSMDLSDAGPDVTVVHEDESMLVGDDDSREYLWSDGDTIEDIMNTPGKTAPPAPEQDLGGVYLCDQPTPDETKVIKLQCVVIEVVGGQERMEHERQEAAAIGDKTIGLDMTSIEDQDDPVVLSGDPEFQAAEAVQAEIGMSCAGHNVEEAIEVEYFEPFDRKTSRCFSPAPPMRRASADPLPSSSVADFSDFRPAVMSTPSGRHLDFTTNSTIHETPFTKTLNYFKQQKGKENSPSKARRKAALPEEIAELVRDAEEEDLDKYRDVDLAPMEPVMESDTAGDLITFGTPVKAMISTSEKSTTHPDQLPHQVTSPLNSDIRELMDLSPIEAALVHLLPKDTEAPSTPSSRLSRPFKQDEDSDADAEYSDTVSNPEDKQLVLYPQHPTFVTVIGMLPTALFWATAAPIAKYSTKVYDALVDRFAGLELSGRGGAWIREKKSSNCAIDFD